MLASPSSVSAVPGAGGRRLPRPEPHLPRGLPGLRVLPQAGRCHADQAAQPLLCHLDSCGGRAHLLVSDLLCWVWCVRLGGFSVQQGARRAQWMKSELTWA